MEQLCSIPDQEDIMSTSTSVIAHERTNLLPKFVHNALDGLTHLSEAFRITCHGVEKTTAGIDEISGIMLSQQRDRLLSEYKRPAPEVIQIS